MKRTHDQTVAAEDGEEEKQQEQQQQQKEESSSAATSESPTPPSPKPSAPKKQKKKESGEETIIYKKYFDKIEKLLPTFHDSKIPGMVEAAAADTIGDSIETLGFEKDTALVKMIPEDRIKKLVVSIIIDEVNFPVRKLVLNFPHHFIQLKDVVMKVDNMKTDSISEELANLEPPGKGEQPFPAFVTRMNNIMVNVVKRAASAIESKELMRGGNPMTNIVLEKIEIPRTVKSKICKHLSNYILTFAGNHIYHFFLENSKLMNRATDKYIR